MIHFNLTRLLSLLSQIDASYYSAMLQNFTGGGHVSYN